MSTNQRNSFRRTKLSLALVCGATAYAANFTVNSTGDSGAGSVRQAILDANANAEADTIVFDASITGSIIKLLSSLPPITSAVTIDGTGRKMTIAGKNFGLMRVDPSGNLTLRGLLFTLGDDTFGGAIRNQGVLTLFACDFLNNIANDTTTTPRIPGRGGALNNEGTAVISYSNFNVNHATLGGAIFNQSGANLTISKSAFITNDVALFGGAIANAGIATLSNTTISDNTAVTGGGGIYSDTSLTLTNVTVDGNHTSAGIGGLHNAGSLFLANTILANNTGGDCGTASLPLVINGPNLVQDSSCGIPSIGPANLAPLAANGGITRSHALLPGSAAIDAGDDRVCAADPVGGTDQRDVSRTTNAGLHCDIGAYERRPPFSFSGFLAPLSSDVNRVNAGSAVPIKFSLGGDQGLSIFAAGSPLSWNTECTTGAITELPSQTSTAGGSTLSYDAASGQYTYTWKTEKSWAGTCRQFIFQLTDDTIHTAMFQFK